MPRTILPTIATRTATAAQWEQLELAFATATAAASVATVTARLSLCEVCGEPAEDGDRICSPCHLADHLTPDELAEARGAR